MHTPRTPSPPSSPARAKPARRVAWGRPSSLVSPFSVFRAFHRQHRRRGPSSRCTSYTESADLRRLGAPSSLEPRHLAGRNHRRLRPHGPCRRPRSARGSGQGGPEGDRLTGCPNGSRRWSRSSPASGSSPCSGAGLGGHLAFSVRAPRPWPWNRLSVSLQYSSLPPRSILATAARRAKTMGVIAVPLLYAACGGTRLSRCPFVVLPGACQGGDGARPTFERGLADVHTMGSMITR